MWEKNEKRIEKPIINRTIRKIEHIHMNVFWLFARFLYESTFSKETVQYFIIMSFVRVLSYLCYCFLITQSANTHSLEIVLHIVCIPSQSQKSFLLTNKQKWLIHASMRLDKMKIILQEMVYYLKYDYQQYASNR